MSSGSESESDSEPNTFTGKIYKIVCDCGCNQCYVGSTRERTLARRMCQHRAASEKTNKMSKLYTHTCEMLD